jgi:hypothetical protein
MVPPLVAKEQMPPAPRVHAVAPAAPVWIQDETTRIKISPHAPRPFIPAKTEKTSPFSFGHSAPFVVSHA